MRFREYMATCDGFARLLEQLAQPSPDPELLEDPDLVSHPALREFRKGEWARRWKAGTRDGPAGLALLVADRCLLLLDRSCCGYKPYVRRRAILLLARFVWPNFQIWVLAARPMPARRSLRSCVTWLKTEGRFPLALQELGVTDAEGRGYLVSEHEFDYDESTLHKWLQRALQTLYEEVCQALGRAE